MSTSFKYILAAAVSLGFFGCASKHIASTSPKDDGRTLAFPGAEGFGKYTTGGRGGRLFVVSNLNDKGVGSFRQAVEAKEDRIVVFGLSGTIHLETRLIIKGNITIAGQSAPGDGICLADQPVSLGGDNIIIRYLRFRMGDKYQKGGMVDGNGGDDAFGGTHRKNIIIDHCSMSWSTDEVFSVYAGDSTTLQWNMISEPLNYSYHFETGDKDYEHHGFGGIWGGRHLTAHHNLFAHCNNRNPRFDGIRNAEVENVDFVNNVIYNWGTNTVYAGEGGHYNLVNNYYRYGPSTKENVRTRVFNPYNKMPQIPFGKFYVKGNYVDGADDVTNDNWKAVVLEKGTAAQTETAKSGQPVFEMSIAAKSASKAYAEVLSFAGASFRRDTLDQRIMLNVKDRTGGLIDVQGNYPHGTEYEKTITAWPVLKSAAPPPDTDKDGIPDEWESKHRMNPNDAADAAKNTIDKNYTNIEVYLNDLIVKN